MKIIKAEENNGIINEKIVGKFFQAIEDDDKLFKETLEVILTLIISDPRLIRVVADLIESDYRELFLAIRKKVDLESEGTNSPSCCHEKFQ